LVEEIFSELETKIEGLIFKVQNFNQEKNKLEKEIEIQKGKNQELETINFKLKEEMRDLKNNFEDQKKKLDITAAKIQGLLSRLESVE
jgi:Seryl-tRNA synthetase N-terminal domain.